MKTVKVIIHYYTIIYIAQCTLLTLALHNIFLKLFGKIEIIRGANVHIISDGIEYKYNVYKKVDPAHSKHL